MFILKGSRIRLIKDAASQNEDTSKDVPLDESNEGVDQLFVICLKKLEDLTTICRPLRSVPPNRISFPFPPARFERLSLSSLNNISVLPARFERLSLSPLNNISVLPASELGALVPYDVVSREDLLHNNVFSISEFRNLEDLPIQDIINRCKKSMELRKRIAIVVRYNPVSHELGPLHIIFDLPSSTNLLAFKRSMRMAGWENILILPEMTVTLVYLSKEVPLQKKKYRVFLVYQGPDVSKTLVGNLLKSLSAGGLKVFDIDLNKWQIDKEKCLGLEQASKGTNIHIPIVSRHYADSFSHLEEFLCMCSSDNLIRPLFYDVDPTDALDIKDIYERNSLPQVSFHTGWTLASYRNEEQLVKRVVFDNVQMVNDMSLYAVGLEERMKDVMHMLKMESDDSVSVGICGSGGIGKSTLAKAIFNNICSRFQASSFIADVKRHKICKFQEQILIDLAGLSVCVKSVEHGKALMKAHLGSIRALVILDDIDNIRQLEAFTVDWLAPGSRVILTSRDLQLFSFGQTDAIYYMEGLPFKHSIELFSWHAFLSGSPDEGYEDRSQRIVKACHGIPLLLEIVGASLYAKKDYGDWDLSTRHLESTVDQDIHRRLSVSYLDLESNEREIFLDIACFFVRNETLETTSRYWKSIGFTPKTALENLVLKSLIRIDDQNQFLMHDYIQEMGRAVVAAESPELGKRRRIWKTEDAIQVISRGLGTGSVRGISICGAEGSNRLLQAEMLAPMTNLQLLWMDGTMVEGDYRKLSPSLRWLRWNSCPLKCLPSEWRIEHTVVLDFSSVPGSSSTELRNLWNETSISKTFTNLSLLRLNYAQNLQKLPDFSKFSSLSTLDLEKCANLRKLPNSIGLLAGLKCLNLSWCRNLVELPDSISKISSLERLFLRHCSSLKELPSAIEELVALMVLDLGFSEHVDKLPSFQRLFHLKQLILAGCWSITVLPDTIGELNNLEVLDIHSLGLILELPSLDKLSCLKKLVLNGCGSLTGLPTSIGKFCSLEYLDMSQCSSICCLPEEFGDLVNLEKLFMNNCWRLSKLPESFGNLSSLTTLELKHNSNLMRLPPSFSQLQSLVWFDASDCNFLDGLPEQIGDLLALQVVKLENNLFCELPLSIDDLDYLRELNLNKCQSLEKLPSLPKGLVKLDVSDCTLLKTIYDMSHLEKLEILILYNCENLVRLPDLKSCQSLEILNISRCRKVRSLAGAEGLSSLKTLYLSGSGVSISGLHQWIKDMPYLQEVSIYANEVPQWLDSRTRDQYLNDENFRDILSCPVKKTTKCRGALLCFVLNFIYESQSGGSLSQNCMKMSIRGDDGEAFWTTVFSNRQKVEGDQLYICLYRENHPLTRTLESTDNLRVMAKGTNIQIIECGLQLLYNGIEDVNLERLEDDLSSLVSNYIGKTVEDKVPASESEFPHATMDEEDGDIYDYGYSTSEDEYLMDEG